MVEYFFDTSAISKHYHTETGTPKVDALLATGGAVKMISRLSVVEFFSAMTKKVRTGQLGLADFRLATRRFSADVSARRLRIVRLLVSHFRSAEQLIRRIGLTQNLRTLDALQLAVVLSLNEPGRALTFVCADHALCAAAAAEGLTVINPEVP
jgi:predicted nucleic acid-binding protein